MLRLVTWLGDWPQSLTILETSLTIEGQKDRPSPILGRSIMASARARGRRKHETIDLTGEDDATMSSQSHHAIPANQAERDSLLLAVQDDDQEADDAVIASTQDANNDDVTVTYQLYGTINTKIVGVQYYRGLASNGEHVPLRREPTNQVWEKAVKMIR